jgi:hypothetical protein
MPRYADYVFRDANDQTRVRVYLYGKRAWSFDVFQRGRGFVSSFHEEGDILSTKHAALEEAKQRFGPLKLISVNTVTEGW